MYTNGLHKPVLRKGSNTVVYTFVQ